MEASKAASAMLSPCAERRENGRIDAPSHQDGDGRQRADEPGIDGRAEHCHQPFVYRLLAAGGAVHHRCGSDARFIDQCGPSDAGECHENHSARYAATHRRGVECPDEDVAEYPGNGTQVAEDNIED